MNIELIDWDDRGTALLEAMNAPEQMAHLGGPESAEKLKERQSRYLTYHQLGVCEMMLVALGREVAGSVGYWETEKAMLRMRLAGACCRPIRGSASA